MKGGEFCRVMEEQNYPQMDFVEEYSLDIPAQLHNTPKSFWFVSGRFCNAHGRLQEEEV